MKNNTAPVSGRKFFKKTMKVEFLSETPFPDNTMLEVLVDRAINDDYSMNITQEKDTKITGKQAARALLNHGSDPSFFQLTDKGEDINE
jgi:hypothetical protein